MNVTVRNVITSMRLVSMINWAEFFESVSPVDAVLRAASDFGSMDFHARSVSRARSSNWRVNRAAKKPRLPRG